VSQTISDRPRLGARVRFSAVLKREKIYGGPVIWKEHPASGSGVYVGFRVVYEGEHVRGGYEDPGFLRCPRGVSHALVAYSERAKPFRVPWGGLHWAGDGKSVSVTEASAPDAPAGNTEGRS
jgi:hypothetical protein